LPNPTIRYLEEARKALSIYQDKAPAIAPTFKAKRRLAASQSPLPRNAVNFFGLLSIITPFGTGNFIRFGTPDFNGAGRLFRFLIRPIARFLVTAALVIVFDRLAEQDTYIPMESPGRIVACSVSP
jgi:hypothetical protein